ncbi:MAG TPA: hypothetical protein VK184_01360 [Nostocaceae cyanobacterium]|nr:hypothetical protein [Nostocaceae cyanobacterium]
MVLLSCWLETLQVFNVDSIAANQAFSEIFTAYSHSSRYYHNLQHIQQVLNTIDSLQSFAQDLASIKLAAWLHDVVYNSQASDNEERSAEYTATLLQNLGVPLGTIANVTRLILQTKHHQADDIDSQILLDADLAILAASSVDYHQYAQAIRQEYIWLTDSEYILGRKRVLENFLMRLPLYHTPLMYTTCENFAHSNMQTEINYLTKLSQVF